MADYKGNADLPGQKRLRALGEPISTRLFKQVTLRRKGPCGVPFGLAPCLVVAWPIATSTAKSTELALQKKQRTSRDPFTPHLLSERAIECPVYWISALPDSEFKGEFQKAFPRRLFIPSCELMPRIAPG